MKIESSGTEIPFLIIRDMYSENELRMIKQEIDFLHSAGCLNSNQNEIGSARNPDGTSQKKAKGVWLDSLYLNRKTSMILTLNRAIMDKPEIVQSFMNLAPYYRSYRFTNADTSLLNYYENTDKYDAHLDFAMYSAITWFFNKPKKFKGGNLIFPELNREVHIEDNMAVIFPSSVVHKVEEIQMNDVDSNGRNGRYSLAQFMFVVPPSTQLSIK
jgi:predicted 2-oxoglutarate/Fe(II)-dependent dioxygenase YbiX